MNREYIAAINFKKGAVVMLPNSTKIIGLAARNITAGETIDIISPHVGRKRIVTGFGDIIKEINRKLGQDIDLRVEIEGDVKDIVFYAERRDNGGRGGCSHPWDDLFWGEDFIDFVVFTLIKMVNRDANTGESCEIKVLKKLIDGGDIIDWQDLPLELQETMFEICHRGWARTFSETETFHITEAGKKVYANTHSH